MEENLQVRYNSGPELSELTEHLHSIHKHMVWFLDGAVWSQELDSMILVDPFQLEMFYDSIMYAIRSQFLLPLRGRIVFRCQISKIKVKNKRIVP